VTKQRIRLKSLKQQEMDVIAVHKAASNTSTYFVTSDFNKTLALIITIFQEIVVSNYYLHNFS